MVNLSGATRALSRFVWKGTETTRCIIHTYNFTTVSLSILWCFQGLHQDSKKQWKAEHPRLTSIINSSRTSPKASGTFPQCVLLLFSHRVISSFTSDEAIVFFCFPQSKHSFSPWTSLAEQPELIPTTPTTSLCLLHVLWGGGKSWSLRPLNQSVSCTVV